MSDRNVSMSESALRKPEFRPGVPITLADGQAWHFPKPVMRFDPVLKDDGTFEFGDVRRVIHGEIDEAYETLVEKVMAGSEGRVFVSDLLNLAILLLRHNYTLDGPTIAAILPRIGDDDRNVSMWNEIAGVVSGQPPKPTDSGSVAS